MATVSPSTSSYREIHRLLADAAESLRLVCIEGVTDPYQCYAWNTVGALMGPLDALTEGLARLERELGPFDDNERLADD